MIIKNLLSAKLASYAFFLSSCIFVGGSYAKKKPNIILIISDDVGFEEIGCYDVIDRESITPNIDRLSEKGVRFNTCYAQAICGPSRAMLYTGNYALHNGSYDNKLKVLNIIIQSMRANNSNIK